MVVSVTVGDAVSVGVSVAVSVDVAVGVGVEVQVKVAEGVDVIVGVNVRVRLAVADGVCVEVAVGVAVDSQAKAREKLVRDPRPLANAAGSPLDVPIQDSMVTMTRHIAPPAQATRRMWLQPISPAPSICLALTQRELKRNR